MSKNDRLERFGPLFIQELDIDQNGREVYRVNLDANPICPINLKIADDKYQIASRATSTIEIGSVDDVRRLVSLYLDRGQMKGNDFVGRNLKKKLRGQPVYSAALLDFLLFHPNMIPDEWKGKFIYFWGTIYRGSGDYLYVRYLFWGGLWCSNDVWLDHDWWGDGPAACRA